MKWTKYIDCLRNNDKNKKDLFDSISDYRKEIEEQLVSMQGKICSQMADGLRLKGVIDEYRLEIQKLEKYEKLAEDRQDLSGLIVYQNKKKELIELEHLKTIEYEKLQEIIEENKQCLEQIRGNIGKLEEEIKSLENIIE